ncbi:hypothetical protein D0C36_23550 [Mucilaginibacter conchicola]|uniref:Uncharacterized protein n=1 Tax=Mucilaginibacter conchicola TaxID=2303333 RepID=A0A372NM29_9SPHI|nr:hypothetical protein [Mucilaginibacter conchicola]RFZ90006.1 hypothetical protein D0C36_23550 [Mucilaginibacter conchicola]
MSDFNNYQGNVERDRFGNFKGDEYDLARDYALTGKTIGILHLYTGEGFDFTLPRGALTKKGFDLIYWKDLPPDASILKKELQRCCQLWVISDEIKKLDSDHLQVIYEFFHQGRGLYIWGDNDPFFADANQITNSLFQTSLNGDYHGDQVLGLKSESGKSGLIPNHPIFTGIEHLYEGITVSALKLNLGSLRPLLLGSDKEVVAGYFDSGGKRAVVDGGFTRLYCNWDSAGTARFVVNAAAWLVNDDPTELLKRLTPDIDAITNKFDLPNSKPLDISGQKSKSIIDKF